MAAAHDFGIADRQDSLPTSVHNPRPSKHPFGIGGGGKRPSFAMNDHRFSEKSAGQPDRGL